MEDCVSLSLRRHSILCAALLCALVSFAAEKAFADNASNPPSVSDPKASEAPAVSPQPQQPAQTVETTAGGSDFPVMRTLGGFALVISLILIAFLAARKIAPQYFNKRPSDRNLRVIETLPVGDKRSVAVIQLGDKRFLIGNTPQQITLLSQLENAISFIAEAEKAPQAEPATPSHANPFRKLYETEKNRGASRAGKEKTIPPDVRAKMRQLREALEG